MTGADASSGASKATRSGAVVAQRYAIEARLGQGGIGAVYLASDTHSGGRAVAVKILREDRVDAERERGLAKEYAMLARLRHPHVEAVLDFGRDPQHGLYIIKEYLSGTDLMRATEGLSPQEILLLSTQLFRALAFLHARKLIHNDIKPDNILVVRDASTDLGRRCVLIDFGIASQYSHEATEQTPTGLVGTLGYLAPERVKGAPPDARTDLYAAGIVLYRLLTRSFPFNHKSQAAELLAFHLYTLPAAPSQLRPGITQAMDGLVLRLLAKDPEARYASAHDVLKGIGRILGKEAPLETEATQEGYVRSVPLVGRDAQMERLAAFVKRGIAGKREAREPGIAIVTGDPGMGKSRVVAELLVQARLLGARVQTGSGRRHGGGLGPFRVPLRRLMTDEEAQRSLSFLQDDGSTERADREELLQTLGRLLLERGSDHVLAIEDLHNTDEMTLDLIIHVGRMLRESPAARLVLLLSSRERSALRLESFWQRLEREGLAHRERLGPLSEEQAMTFVTQALGQRPPVEFVSVLHRRTGGDPEALQEALKLLMGLGVLSERTWTEAGAWDMCADSLPEGVLPILSARLSLLAPEVRDTLRVLALVSRSLAAQTIATVAGHDLQKALYVLGDLAKREMILTRVIDGELYYLLAHDRMAQAVLSSVPEAEQRDTHDRIARAIEAFPDKLRDDWLLDLAHHAIRSGKVVRAATHGLKAGRRLEALYAWDQATELYQDLVRVPCLEGETLVAALLRLGAINEQTGDYPTALRHLAAADRQAHILKLDAERAAALHRAAAIAARRGNRWKAEVRAIKALMLYEKVDDRIGVANIKLLMAQFLYEDKDYKRGLKLVTEARRLYEEMGDVPGLGEALNLRGMILWRQRKLDEASHYFKQSFRMAGLVGALANWGSARFELGDYGEANRIFRDALGLAKRQGRLRDRAVVEMSLGSLRYEEGQLKKSRRLCLSAYETFESLGERTTAAIALASLARLQRESGSLDEAGKLVSRSLDMLKDQPASTALGTALRQMAYLALLRGDLEQARKAATRAARTDARWGETKALGYDALCLAEIALERGSREDFLREIFDARSAFGSVHSGSGLLATDVLLARGERYWGTARECLKQLVECQRTARVRKMRFWDAMVEAEIAALALAMSKPDEALAGTENALAYARGEGVRTLELALRLTRSAAELQAGRLAEAVAELKHADGAATDPLNVVLAHRALCQRSQVLRARGRLSEALAQAASVAQNVRELGMVRLTIESDLLIAAIAAQADRPGIAKAAEGRAHEAARAAGFRCYE